MRCVNDVAWRQIYLPAARLWVGLGPDGVHVRRHHRERVISLAAVSVLLGPGGSTPDVLAHGADGAVWKMTATGKARYLDCVVACDADLNLLVAAREGPILHLESARSCTTLTLPEEPRIVCALGATQRMPHLALVVLREATWLVSWAEGTEEVRVQHVVAGYVAAALLLGGQPALVVARMPWGAHDRLLSWQVIADHAGAPDLLPLPAVLAASDTPTAARNPPKGPILLAGQATWMAYRAGTWVEAQEPPPQGALCTRILASTPAVEPMHWLGQKQHAPSQNKLADAAMDR